MKQVAIKKQQTHWLYKDNLDVEQETFSNPQSLSSLRILGIWLNCVSQSQSCSLSGSQGHSLVAFQAFVHELLVQDLVLHCLSARGMHQVFFISFCYVAKPMDI